MTDGHGYMMYVLYNAVHMSLIDDVTINEGLVTYFSLTVTVTVASLLVHVSLRSLLQSYFG